VFTGSGATGASSDATGYLDQCYNQTTSGTATPVSVATGETNAAIDAPMVGVGAP
jgi:hypothetical protein